MRLQKFLAHCGVASRRKCEEFIKEGMVKVNGELIKELGHKINPQIDIVEFKNIRVYQNEKNIYILLNKPTGYITSVNDQFNRKTIMDLISDVEERIYPVGRLDYDSAGMLIMTNDGAMTYKLTHPKHEIDKEYLVHIQGVPTLEKINNFKNGLKIEDYITSNAEFNIIKINKGNALVSIIIHEGKNRQIRKMCDKIGHPVLSLKRIRIGEVSLGDLPSGKWRFLSETEIAYLKRKTLE
jgi:23S rRNA pseudouridine2605 synthase